MFPLDTPAAPMNNRTINNPLFPSHATPLYTPTTIFSPQYYGSKGLEMRELFQEKPEQIDSELNPPPRGVDV